MEQEGIGRRTWAAAHRQPHIGAVLSTKIHIFVRVTVVKSAGKGNQEHQGCPILGSGSLQNNNVLQSGKAFPDTEVLAGEISTTIIKLINYGGERS